VSLACPTFSDESIHAQRSEKPLIHSLEKQNLYHHPVRTLHWSDARDWKITDMMFNLNNRYCNKGPAKYLPLTCTGNACAITCAEVHIPADHHSEKSFAAFVCMWHGMHTECISFVTTEIQRVSTMQIEYYANCWLPSCSYHNFGLVTEIKLLTSHAAIFP